MKIGVHLPNAIPGVTGSTLIEWARRIDASPLAHLGVTDRLAYDTIDAVVTLTAAAAVTERVELVSNILIAPLRSPGLFAKEIASLSVLAPGRLTVGVAVGARPQDYESAPVPWGRRGVLIDQCLDALQAMAEPVDWPNSVGPRPQGVEILVGGASTQALARLCTHCSGYTGGGVKPMFFGFEVQAIKAAWADAGREGEPRIVGSTWAASEERLGAVEAWQRSYLERGGPPEPVRSDIAVGADGVRQAVDEYRAAGATEMLFNIGSDDIAELEWFIEAATPLIEPDPG